MLNEKDEMKTPGDVISEAFFTTITVNRHGELAAMDLSTKNAARSTELVTGGKI